MSVETAIPIPFEKRPPQKGDKAILRRPLADFLVEIHWVQIENGLVSIRYLDGEPSSFNIISGKDVEEDLIPLDGTKYESLQPQLDEAMRRQREVIIPLPRQRAASSAKKEPENPLAKLSPELLRKVLDIMAADAAKKKTQ